LSRKNYLTQVIFSGAAQIAAASQAAQTAANAAQSVKYLKNWQTF